MVRSSPTAFASGKCFFRSLFKGAENRNTAFPPPAPSGPVAAEGFTFRFSRSIREMPSDWDAVMSGRNVFLERNYLGVLEATPPGNAGFGYLLSYKGRHPVGVAALQFFDFDAATHIRLQRQAAEGPGATGPLKQALARRLKFRVLVCGNMLLTGEHGFFFLPGAIEAAKAVQLLEQSLDWVASHPAAAEPEAAVIVIKDLYAGRRDLMEGFESEGFHRISFQPSMILDIRPEWTSFDDYLDSMTSKYRVRARRAFKKATGVRRRALSLAEITELETEMYARYACIADGADFNMVDLHRHYLSNLKREFPDSFRVTGHFKGEKLVGFHTTFRNGEELEAHFLGFDEEENRRHQLYLNMLYDIAGEGISCKVKRVVLSRTALEIKSSIGARPRDMYVLLRARHRLFNKIAPFLVEYLEPKVAWTERHPFG